MKTAISILIYFAFFLCRVFIVWAMVDVAMVISKGTPFHWLLASAIMITMATTVIFMAVLFIMETNEYMNDKIEEND